MATPNRMYAPLWNSLKLSKIGAIQPTQSKDPEIFKKWVRAARKGVQKEKYNDSGFRVRYPNAILTSTVDHDNNKVTFFLDLGLGASLEDLPLTDGDQ